MATKNSKAQNYMFERTWTYSYTIQAKTLEEAKNKVKDKYIGDYEKCRVSDFIHIKTEEKTAKGKK